MSTKPVPLLDVSGLRVSFGGKEVVHGIDFQVADGEKLALVGESGSGKTVTALAMLRLALNARYSGSARFRQSDGSVVDLLSMPEQRLRGIRGEEIAMIFQEPMTAFNPLYTVGDQVSEVIQLKQGLDRAQAAERAVALLAETGIPEPARRAQSYPHQLSGGQRQRAMIAMALACKPKLLLADEPTTALDVSLRGQILGLLDRLQREYGMAVLLITHDLNLVRRFADRVAIMEHGHLLEHGPVSSVFAHPTHDYTRRLLASRPERRLFEAEASAGEALMEARDVSVAYPIRRAGVKGWFGGKDAFVAVRNASFTIATARTLGVVGESGSGKSTLALAALGLQPATGEMRIAGQGWGTDAAADKALRARVQVVFQDPFSSLSPRLTIEEIVGEGLRVHAPELGAAERRLRVLAALVEVGLDEHKDASLLSRYPHEFSGGQRQRIAIARALIVRPRLLVLDEPTSALDVTIQKQVLELLQRLQREQGLSYLLITHDVAVIRAMAHEVMVMKDGSVVESGATARVLDHPEHPYTRTLVAAAS